MCHGWLVRPTHFYESNCFFNLIPAHRAILEMVVKEEEETEEEEEKEDTMYFY